MLSIKELPRIIRFLPKIVLAVIVTTCDEVYKKIAYWLNDMGAWGLGAIWGGHGGGAGRGDPPPKLTPSAPQRTTACRVPTRNTSSSKSSW